MAYTVHVKYEGRSDNIDFYDLIQPRDFHSLGIPEGSKPTPQSVTTTQLQNALAIHYDRPVSDFQEMHFETNANGNITVRPQAVFG